MGWLLTKVKASTRFRKYLPMFSTGRLTSYGTLVSVLCAVVFAAETAVAQNASPSASPAVSASPAATPSATPVGPDSTATANNNGTGSDFAWPQPAKTDPKTSLTTGEPTVGHAGKTTLGANSDLLHHLP